MRPLKHDFNHPHSQSPTLAVYVDLCLLLNLGHEESLNSCQISISGELQELFFRVQLFHEALQKIRRRKQLKRRMCFISPTHRIHRCFRGTKPRGVRVSLASESQTCRLKAQPKLCCFAIRANICRRKKMFYEEYLKNRHRRGECVSKNRTSESLSF